jgi:hypothetical protein
MRIRKIIVITFFLELVVCFVNRFVAPYILDSRIERLYDKGLPKVSVEKQREIYCRMKTDDFRLPLPPGSHAVRPVITSGSIDSVDGTVEARFDGSNVMTPNEYEKWLAGRLQVGAYVTSESVPGGLAIKFHYFGDF